jgi:hypothetical protein
MAIIKAQRDMGLDVPKNEGGYKSAKGLRF